MRYNLLVKVMAGNLIIGEHVKMIKYEEGYLERQRRWRERGVFIYMILAISVLIIESVWGYINDEFMICFWSECVTALFFVLSGSWYLPVTTDRLTEYIKHSSPESAGLLLINRLVIANVPVRGKHLYQARHARDVQIHKSILKNQENGMFITLSQTEKADSSDD